MNDTINNESPRLTDDTPRNKEIAGETTHYLDDPAIRKVIAELWPNISVGSLEKAVKPIISNNPDELETWESAQRKKRNATLKDRSGDFPLQTLMWFLYEECFGVNATPGLDESFHDSYAPTTGGMISHGHPRSITYGYTLEAISQLSYSGSTAKEAVHSLSDYRERDVFAHTLAEICVPTKIGNSLGVYESNIKNGSIVKRLLSPDLQPEEEVTTWALRFVQLIKKYPEFFHVIQDTEVTSRLGFGEGVKVNLLRLWPTLWSRMSKAFLQSSETGVATYKDPSDESVKQSIGELLALRVNPEFQILFKYLSPSGYLNEKN